MPASVTARIQAASEKCRNKSIADCLADPEDGCEIKTFSMDPDLFPDVCRWSEAGSSQWLSQYLQNLMMEAGVAPGSSRI